MSLCRFVQSGIGRKVIMGVTGLALIGFLVSHVAGNLLLLFSPGSFNAYSHALISNPFIYGAEAILVLLFVGHLVNGIMVTIKNRAARPDNYKNKVGAGFTSRKSLSSATMIISGIILLIFVPLHIKTFKYGALYEVAGDPAVRDLARLVYEVFSQPLYVAWYVVALLIIGGHLWHGFNSAFESLGFRYRKGLRCTGHALAVVITSGFLVIPLYIYCTGGAS